MKHDSNLPRRLDVSVLAGLVGHDPVFIDGLLRAFQTGAALSVEELHEQAARSPDQAELEALVLLFEAEVDAVQVALQSRWS